MHPDLRIPTRKWGNYRPGHAAEELGVATDGQNAKTEDVKNNVVTKEEDVRRDASKRI